MSTHLVLLAAGLLTIVPAIAAPQAAGDPQTIDITSGARRLRAYVWRPDGAGPFPAVLFNHGSYSNRDPMSLDDARTLGGLFAAHGYLFMYLFRQGIGLSADQGTADGEQMARAFKTAGQRGRNRVQLDLLEHEELDEAFAALAWLRGRREVDTRRVAVAGHSFGGSLSLLMVERDAGLRAAVIFGGAAGSWSGSRELRARLLAAVRRTSAAVFFVHAANDYSTAPGTTLAAEMQRLGKPHRAKIYPPFGRTTREGHNIVYGAPSTWEAEVFAFLASHLRDR